MPILPENASPVAPAALAVVDAELVDDAPVALVDAADDDGIVWPVRAADDAAAVVYEGRTIAVRGTPPARDAAELVKQLRAAGRTALAKATGTWLTSGRRASTETRAAYVRDLSWWLHWCTALDVDPAKPSPADADAYGAACLVAGLAPATAARRLAAASSWYKYAERAAAATTNPFEAMERPRIPNASATRALSRDEVAATLVYADDHESLRTRAVLWLLYLTGTRVGALLAADVDAYRHHAGERVLVLLGKGGERHHLVLPAPAVAALDAYLADRGDPEAGPLLATRTGGRLDRAYVQRLIRRVADAAGVPDAHQLSPHSMRHAYATHALGDGVPLHDVQDALLHADPRTTRRYDDAQGHVDRTPNHGLAARINARIKARRQ